MNVDVVLRITSVSLFKLWSGAVRSSSFQRERERITAALASQEILPLDEQAAYTAGTCGGKLRQQGTPLEAEDVLIAGIALIHEEAVLTRNEQHFSRVPDLEVETY